MNGKTGIDCKSGAEFCQGKTLINKFAPTKKEKGNAYQENIIHIFDSDAFGVESGTFFGKCERHGTT